MAITNLVATSPETFGQNDKSQLSQTRECNLATPQPLITPRATSNPSTPSESEQKTWASRQVQIIQTEILTLERDIVERTNIVASIEQDIGNLQEEYDKYLQTRDQDMARGVAEINEAYNTMLDVLKRMLMQLAESKRNELEEEYNKNLINKANSRGNIT